MYSLVLNIGVWVGRSTQTVVSYEQFFKQIWLASSVLVLNKLQITRWGQLDNYEPLTSTVRLTHVVPVQVDVLEGLIG